MMAFEFPEVTRAKLVYVHPDSERHGDVLVATVHLRFEVDMPNTVLERYAPGLKDRLYIAGENHELPGIDPVSDATELRYPELGMPLKWNDKAGGYTLVIDYGIADQHRLRLTDCTLHKHLFTAKKGGTCKVGFTLSCTEGLTPDTLGHLGMHVQHDVHIQLTQPVPEPA
jgi:hypothetical protein